jgi:hypothetical protein
MDRENLIALIRQIESPLKKQLLTAALISKLLEERGKAAPIVIGGCALSYYSREVYFTSDIDFAYADREAFDEVLSILGFSRRGRYWVREDMGLAVEVPASSLPGEESPVEIVEFDGGLQCSIIGLEDLIIDRMNACKHRKSETDCEMVELLLRKYSADLDWGYLEKKAAEPPNDSVEELQKMRGEQADES